MVSRLDLSFCAQEIFLLEHCKSWDYRCVPLTTGVFTDHRCVPLTTGVGHYSLINKKSPTNGKSSHTLPWMRKRSEEALCFSKTNASYEINTAGKSEKRPL